MIYWIAAILALLAVAIGLRVGRLADRRAARRDWQALRAISEPDETFDPAVLDGLPEPARRYLRFSIAPGTRLRGTAVIGMTGSIGLGSTERPAYRPFRGRQILAGHRGLVWCLKSGAITGADCVLGQTSRTRFWWFGVLPIVRRGGDEDHRRSALGRVVSETALWAPAAMLPGAAVRWEAPDGNTARARVLAGGFEHLVDITVAPDGRPTRVVVQRWSDENPEKEYRLQSFGGDLSRFARFDGFHLATHLEGGNHIGTDAFFPFYIANVDSIEFGGTDG